MSIMPRYSFDPACADLAAHFLRDGYHTRADEPDLAQHIQSAVEEWFRSREAERMPASDENTVATP